MPRSVCDFAATVLRQQRSFRRRCCILLQLVYAALWWLVLILSLKCSRAAAVALGGCRCRPRKHKGTVTELAEAGDARKETEAATPQQGAATPGTEVVATANITAAADTTAAEAAITDITAAATTTANATEVGVAAGKTSQHFSRNLISSRVGAQSSGEDDSSALRTSSSRGGIVFVQIPFVLGALGQREVVLYALNWRTRIFVATTTVAALLTGLNLFLLLLWKNDWDGIDATIFRVTGTYAHYTYFLIVATSVGLVYTLLLLLSICCCLLPHLFFPPSTLSSPSRPQSPRKEPLSLLHHSSQWTSSLGLPPCTAGTQGSAVLMASTLDNSTSVEKGTHYSTFPPHGDVELPACDEVGSGLRLSEGVAAAPAAFEGNSAFPDPPSSPAVAEAFRNTSSPFTAYIRPSCSCSSTAPDKTCIAAEKGSRIPSFTASSLAAASFPSKVSPSQRAVSAAAPAPRVASAATSAAHGSAVSLTAAEAAAGDSTRFCSGVSGSADYVYASPHFFAAAAGEAGSCVPALGAPPPPAFTLPPTAYVALGEGSEEAAGAAMCYAWEEEQPIQGGEGDTVCIPLLFKEDEAVIRISPLHMVLVAGVIVGEANISFWTLYLGLELYFYVYFFIQFYAPFIYATLLPLVTLLLAAIILAPLYNRPSMVQMFSAPAPQPPSTPPLAYQPRLRAESNILSTAASPCGTAVPAASSSCVACSPASWPRATFQSSQQCTNSSCLLPLLPSLHLAEGLPHGDSSSPAAQAACHANDTASSHPASCSCTRLPFHSGEDASPLEATISATDVDGIVCYAKTGALRAIAAPIQWNAFSAERSAGATAISDHITPASPSPAADINPLLYACASSLAL